jgi:hypothetical protein
MKARLREIAAIKKKENGLFGSANVFAKGAT